MHDPDGLPSRSKGQSIGQSIDPKLHCRMYRRNELCCTTPRLFFYLHGDVRYCARAVCDSHNVVAITTAPSYHLTVLPCTVRKCTALYQSTVLYLRKQSRPALYPASLVSGTPTTSENGTPCTALCQQICDSPLVNLSDLHKSESPGFCAD